MVELCRFVQIRPRSKGREMALSEAQLKEILKQNKGGTYDGFCGPVKFGSTLIWEIWVSKGERRYVIEGGQTSPLYFESFYALGPQIDDMLSDASKKGAALKNRMYIERVSRYVASTRLVLCSNACPSSCRERWQLGDVARNAGASSIVSTLAISASAFVSRP